MMGRESCLRIIREVIKGSRADQTEAVLMTEDSSLTRFARSAVHQHVAEKNGTLIIRAVVGKRIAVVTTNVLQVPSIRSSLDKAIQLARVQSPNEDFVSLPEPRPIPETNTFAESIARLTPERKVKRVKDLIAFSAGKGFLVSGAFSNAAVEIAVANSLGTEVYQEYSDLFFHTIAENGNSSGYASFVSRDPDQLDVERLGEEAIGKASHGEPVQVDPGEYEVILEADAVSELLSFLGYLGFHALSVQEGRSFFCGQFGRKMVDESVTLYDDGLEPGGLQVPFDFEGVPKRKVIFFEHGVAKEVTYDSLTAKREGKESTGHGLIAPNTAGPIPINLVMEGGASSLEEMIRSSRKAIYVTRFHYTNVVEAMKAVITGMTRDGTFLVEDGEIKRPVRNLRFTESVLGALSRVKAVSKERKVCSEGTIYSRRFMTGTIAPALRIDGFNFSGVSALE
jgi:PmbA protein